MVEAPPSVVRVSKDTLLASGGVLAEVHAHLGVVVPGFLDPAICAAHARAVEAARAEWTADFDAVQFSLGRAWYTHLEQDRVSEYFRDAEASNARVERHLPGLQSLLIDAVRAITGKSAAQRRGWCGPGVHVFPAGEWLSQNGGDIHYDNEGIPAPQVARRAPALSMVLMFQPPARGGGLRIWQTRYHGTDEVDDDDTAAPSALVDYDVGDLLIFDSYRLHQIQPFEGAINRISATAHALDVGSRWEVWF